MTRDIEVLRHWLMVALWVAAVCSTLFPILYAFSPWWKYLLGRLLMLTMFSLALAVDMTLIFQYWQPTDILVYFWIELAVFSLIALSTLGMCFKMFVLNYGKPKK